MYWGNLKRIVLCTFDLTDLLRSLNNPWVWRKEYWAWPQVREFHEFLIASFRGITYSYTLKENLVLVKKQKLLPLDLRTLELMVSALKIFKQEGTNSVLTYDFLCFYHSISDCRAETGWSNQKTPNTLCGAQHSILLLLSSLFLLSIIKSDTIIDFTTRQIVLDSILNFPTWKGKTILFWPHSLCLCGQNGIVFPFRVGKLKFHACSIG